MLESRASFGLITSRRNGRTQTLCWRKPGLHCKITTEKSRPSLTVHCTGPPPAVDAVHESQALWSTYVSRRLNVDLAVEDALSSALESAASTKDSPSVAFVFVSSAFSNDYDKVVPEVRKHLPSIKVIVGCTGMGVIGATPSGPEEVEHVPAISITLCSLPGVTITAAHVDAKTLPDGDAPPEQWSNLFCTPLDVPPQCMVVLADPAWAGLNNLLAGLDFAFPDATVVGGLTSAGRLSSSRALFMWAADQVVEATAGSLKAAGVYRTGALVVAMGGEVCMDLIVAQGCRPLLSSSSWVVEELSGASSVAALRPEGRSGEGGGALAPLKALQQDLSATMTNVQQLREIVPSLVLGLAPPTPFGAAAPSTSPSSLSSPSPASSTSSSPPASSPGSAAPEQLLIRSMGFDSSGALLVAGGERLALGTRCKFMVRDRLGAMQDMESWGMAYKRRELEASLLGQSRPAPLGALIFSCNGRGSDLYQQSHYDSTQINTFVPVPSSGFLCNGEIAKVGGRTQLHGFTCAAAIVRRGARLPPPPPPPSNP